jgi:dihydroorotate dehydrogenase electron transfer subunit
MGLYKKATIIKKKQETDNVCYFTFDISINAKAGQFVMAWLAGEDEKPFSVANNSPFELAIANVGPISKKITSLNIGDSLFIRGPFGKPFRPIGKKWLLVGGGYGFAPLRFLARQGIKKNCSIDCIIGARSKNLLMQPIIHKNIRNFFTTDDGSKGIKGNVLIPLVDLLEKNKYDCIYACGPEKMLFNIAKIAASKNIKCQLSIERYYKCGFGLCGHCSVNGWLSCFDGPILDAKKALKLKDFGHAFKDQCGKKISF